MCYYTYSFVGKVGAQYETHSTCVMGGKKLAKGVGMRARDDFNLFHLTWPIFLEIFLFSLMGLVDTFMLSAVSDNAVSGVGTANTYIHISILILEVVGNGAAIVVAQYLGSRRYIEATKISALAISLNLAFGLVMSVLFVWNANRLMEVMNLQGDVLYYAQSYLAIVGGGIFLQALINALAAIIRVHGLTKQTMYISLAMNVVHIGLNYVLIFGKFGAPELGVQGAAISSIVSRALAVIVFFWLLTKALHVKIMWKNYITWNGEFVRKILNIGLPSAGEQVLYQCCQLIFLYYVTYLGSEALAARQYANNISMFTYLTALAVGMGTSIIVGRLIGAGRSDEAYARVWKSLRISFSIGLVVVLVTILFREPLMRVFTDDPEIIRLGSMAILCGILLETGRIVNITIINSLRASGDAGFPLRAGFFSMLCMSVPLGYYFVFVLDWGLIGVWLAISADEWVRAILSSLRWRSLKWQRYALVEQKDGE